MAAWLAKTTPAAQRRTEALPSHGLPDGQRPMCPGPTGVAGLARNPWIRAGVPLGSGRSLQKAMTPLPDPSEVVKGAGYLLLQVTACHVDSSQDRTH